MRRVQLIHWNAGEARARVDLLRELGFDAAWEALQGGPSLNRFDGSPPDVFVIDLTRLPSHGRDVAAVLRVRKATRAVPQVFAGGDPEKVARLRVQRPDAVYTDWDRMGEAVAEALARPVATPVARSPMEAYRGRPLAAKLGINAGTDVLLVGAPDDFTIDALPEGARVSRRAGSTGAARVLLFARSRADLERRFQAAARQAREGNGLWLLWPKKTSGVRSELTQQSVREFGMNAGWVDYKICSVDDTWSGLQFARRRRQDGPGRVRSKPAAGAPSARG